jgi:membrane protein insertase Oxa1/YidC/SpoIIIJ
LTWIDDLARPDALISWPPIHLPFGMTLRALNVLPVLLGVVFYLQQKYTPKPAAATKEQEQQQKMMQWMSLLFPLFLYNGPSGLNLYILTSTSIGIIEMKIIRKHIKEQEEREAAGPIIVDAPGTTTVRAERAKRAIADAKKRGGIAGWLADLQQRAEDVRKNADKRKP